MKTLRLLNTCAAALLCCAADAQPTYTVEPVPYLCEQAADEANYTTQFLKSNWKVIEGHQGWLFNTHRDLNDVFGFAQQDELDNFKRFAAALRERGTELLLVYTPTRGLMNHDKTAAIDDHTHAVLKQQYAKALQQLRSVGVTVPALDTLIGQHEDFYYKRDLHWTPVGAEAVAKLVANSVFERGLVAPKDTLDYETRYDGLAGVDASIQAASEQICGNQLPVQYVKAYKTTQKLDTDAIAGASLFGDEDAQEIVLIGTSFSALEKFNFSGFLEQHINAQVNNFAISGGQATGAWIDYLKSDSFQDSPPDIVIWELPAYYKLDTQRIFSFLNPLLYGGCESTEPLAHERNVTFKPGGIANELLFNGGKHTRASKDLVLDVQFSDKEISVLEATVWFGSGTNKTYRLKRNSRARADGRFVFELGGHPMHGNEPVIAMDIEEVMMVDGKPASENDVTHLRADIKLCAISGSAQPSDWAAVRHEK